jgi:hypothetical protein
MYLIIIILINVLNRIRATAGQRSELENLQVVTEIKAAEYTVYHYTEITAAEFTRHHRDHGCKMYRAHGDFS